jgi:hypothetical protein
MLQFEERSGHLMMELLEMALGDLGKAVDEFDPGRGQTLEDYIRWALMRRLATYKPAGPKAHRRVDPVEYADRMKRALRTPTFETPMTTGKRYAPGPDIPEKWGG